jgi:hypothetical protein
MAAAKGPKKKPTSYVPPMAMFPEIVVDASDPKRLSHKRWKARTLDATKRRNGASAKTKARAKKKREAL